MELAENEKRRASNLIWNAAENYAFEPDFRVFDEDGKAELYWNSIIGAVRRDYDWRALAELFRSFRGTVAQETYESLLWLGLENAAFLRECRRRPALPALRERYARRAAAAREKIGNDRLTDVLIAAHFRRALGEDPALKPADRELLDALEFPPELSTEEIVARTTALFKDKLGYQEPAEDGGEPAEKEKRTAVFSWLLRGRRRDNRIALPAVRGFAFGFGEHAGEYGGKDAGRDRPGVQFPVFSTVTEESLRQYIVNYFGPLSCPEQELRSMEKEYCTGAHQSCHLHLTRGGDDRPIGGYAGAQKRAALKQMERNRSFYASNLAQNRTAITRLTNRLRNTLLTQLEATVVKSNAGKLVGGRVWRGLYLDDRKVFDRELRGDTGNLSVDILLDASTSQLDRQEVISTQCYIIAESLTRCGLPVRVASFCSMSGYTVMNLFRDYGETGANENIFRYFTNGCNRDGLAIRLTAGEMKKTDCEHKLLILLSDAKPNDVGKVRTGPNLYRDYTERVGVEDAASEVHQARLNGICVVCVFTGNDDDLPAARKIYGRDFARIRSLEQFSDTVGALIQNQIKNL